MPYYLVLDTETGGTNPETNALLQVSAIVVQSFKGEGVDRIKEANYRQGEPVAFNNYIDPSETKLICDFQAYAIHHLDAEFLKENGLDEQECLLELTRFSARYRTISGRFPTLIGWNIDFDISFLRAAFDRQSLPYPFYWRSLDVSALWHWWNLVHKGTEDYGGIQDAAKRILDKQVPHSAIEDCFLTLDLLKRFEGRFVIS